MACAAAECSSWAPEHAAFSTPRTVETWHLSPKSFSIIKHELMFQAEASYMTGGMHAQKQATTGDAHARMGNADLQLSLSRGLGRV